VNVTFDMESAPEILYRVGRRPHVWEWRDWRTAFPDRTFHNRWDDPKGEYRVLYAASSRFGAYLEVLSWARPDLELLADCSRIEDNDPTAPRTMPPGRLPPGWRNNLIIGKGVSASKTQTSWRRAGASISSPRSLSVGRPAAAQAHGRHPCHSALGIRRPADLRLGPPESQGIKCRAFLTLGASSGASFLVVTLDDQDTIAQRPTRMCWRTEVLPAPMHDRRSRSIDLASIQE